ncbi:MAG: hypothetical protein AAF500_01935 [Myxococcota bacterium]
MRSSPIVSTGFGLVAALLIVTGFPAAPAGAQPDYTLFESGPVRPIALSPDGSRLFAVNTPDGHLEIYDLTGAFSATPTDSVSVGLEPVAVAARNNNEVWVVNHLSDSVSVVDVGANPPRVVRTLLVGDEPRDIVFAGPGGNRAFITTAHRGQNSPYPDGEYGTEGIGRADVWVFDATNLGSGLGGDEETIITLFGDRPRALAVSPDGSRVYAAVFRSGNQTAPVIEFLVCDKNASVPCTVQGTQYPARMPLPWENIFGQESADTSLIVGFDAGSGQWRDENDNNWNPAIRFDLPDWDVFEIDANAGTPVALEDGAVLGVPGVGTILFNMAVNPVNGDVYVSNTEANNRIRFEGLGEWADPAELGPKPSGDPATVRGNLHRAQITVLDASADNGGTARTEFNVIPRALNKHIPYGAHPVPANTRFQSLATPLQMAVTADGSTLYVAGFGSNNVAFYDTTELENDTFVQDGNNLISVGAQPAGLVLDEANDRLYVATRTRVYMIDTTTNTLLPDTRFFFTPETVSILNGRKFLYDAVLTSSNGEASCSSCHVFGDMDDLTWDLGDPDLPNVANNNPQPVGIFGPALGPFDANKGPMTTQTLRGLKFGGPQHWRGDRTGPECLATPADPACADRAFNEFDVAFEGLLGLDEGPLNPTGPLNAADMQKFTDFALQITLPPNPTRSLDNSLNGQQQAGLTAYDKPFTDGLGSCNDCHELDRAAGKFGNGGGSTTEGLTMEFKVPHLRNAYQKVGMFGLAPTGPIPNPTAGGANMGPQVRGTGYLHDGSVDTVASFLSASAFTSAAPNPLNPGEVLALEALIMAFDTDMAPIVGQQVTLTNTSGAAVDARITLLINRADAAFVLPGNINTTECELIVKGVVGGVQRGWLYVGSDNFDPDVTGEAFWSRQDLETEAAVPGQALTFTCVPPGSGERMGINRDRDENLDGEDMDPDAFNPPASDCRVGPTTSGRTSANLMLLVLLGLGCRLVSRRRRRS